MHVKGLYDLSTAKSKGMPMFRLKNERDCLVRVSPEVLVVPELGATSSRSWR